MRAARGGQGRGTALCTTAARRGGARRGAARRSAWWVGRRAGAARAPAAAPPALWGRPRLEPSPGRDPGAPLAWNTSFSISIPAPRSAAARRAAKGYAGHWPLLISSPRRDPGCLPAVAICWWGRCSRDACVGRRARGDRVMGGFRIGRHADRGRMRACRGDGGSGGAGAAQHGGRRPAGARAQPEASGGAAPAPRVAPGGSRGILVSPGVRIHPHTRPQVPGPRQSPPSMPRPTPPVRPSFQCQLSAGRTEALTAGGRRGGAGVAAPAPARDSPPARRAGFWGAAVRTHSGASRGRAGGRRAPRPGPKGRGRGRAATGIASASIGMNGGRPGGRAAGVWQCPSVCEWGRKPETPGSVPRCVEWGRKPETPEEMTPGKRA
jgi:hypothetical protein